MIFLSIFIFAAEGLLRACNDRRTVKSANLYFLVGISLATTILLALAPNHLFGQTPSDGIYTLFSTSFMAIMLIGCGLHVFSRLSK